MNSLLQKHRKQWETLLLLALSLLLAGLTLWYGAAGVNAGLFHEYLKSPLLVLLNLLPVALLLFLLYFATGRPWVAFLCTALLSMALALTDYYKLLLRNDPLLFSDLLLVGEATNITKRYTLTVDARLIVWLAVLAAIVVGLARVFRGRSPLRARIRVAGALGCALAMAGLMVFAYPSKQLYAQTGNAAEWTPTSAYVSHGMLYPFLHSVSDAIDTPPAGYSADAARALLAQTPDEDMPQSKKVHVVCVMLEAFNDLSKFEQIDVDPSAYAALHQLEAESWHGELVSNIFAGGTVDTERCFLTGYFAVPSPRRDTESFVWYMQRQGYRTCGVHPWYSWFYNRTNVNAYLGLQSYAFLEDRFRGSTEETPRTDDATFFSEVSRDLAQAEADGVPLFSYNLTYQNHGPYSTQPQYATALAPWKDGYNEADYHILNNYLSGVKDTGEQLAAFAERLRADDAPVVLVAFGDHNPWLGDGNSVYAMLDININQADPQGFYNYYCTPYLIWANDAAKAALGFDFVGEGGRRSACFLLPELFRLGGMKGSAAMQAMAGVRERTDYVNCIAYGEDGVPTRREAEPDWLAEAERVQYYLLHTPYADVIR